MSTSSPSEPSSLVQGPIVRTLFFFSLPILLGNVLQSLNGSINAIWVGNFLGETALAATSNVNLLMFLLISSIFGLAMASVILIGQNLGAKRIEEAKKVVGTSIMFFFSLSIIVSILGYVASPIILDWMNTPADAKSMAVTYSQLMFLGTPFLFGFNLVMAILRGSGDSKTPFYFLLLSAVIDIGLNPILIRGIGPIPAMGIAGSAIATFIAQCLSFVLLVMYLYRKKYMLRITKKERHLLRFDWEIIRITIQKGVPMGLNLVVVSLSNLILIHLVNSYGSEATAAFGVASQISNYVQMPAMAVGGAVTSMAAQNIGAGRWDRVSRITWTGVLFNVVLTGIIVVLLHFFNRQALGLFLPSEGKAIELGMNINNITLWSFIIFGIFTVVASVIRASGAVIGPLLVSFTALLFVRNPLAIYLSHAHGFNAIWWSFPLGFAVATTLNLLNYRFGKWKKIRLIDDSTAASVS
ncbi:putative MATE family efflux protein [Paenibacillus shirakamiensis]|uniref:MATE family efflux protein n=1 Tax=Paenibacillus shirakamiensis TaxID=1265935 RepID=A0ABS4JEP1_9BACL|nr:MATE family efflux transporter [Paenibacillus shirakamiensis]MBP2000184.1 putative MATE family efflux protein [Paenibacillus shirakamiensis]